MLQWSPKILTAKNYVFCQRNILISILMFAEDFPRSYDMDLLAVSPLHNCYSHTLAKNLRRPHAKDP